MSPILLSICLFFTTFLTVFTANAENKLSLNHWEAQNLSQVKSENNLLNAQCSLQTNSNELPELTSPVFNLPTDTRVCQFELSGSSSGKGSLLFKTNDITFTDNSAEAACYYRLDKVDNGTIASPRINLALQAVNEIVFSIKSSHAGTGLLSLGNWQGTFKEQHKLEFNLTANGRFNEYRLKVPESVKSICYLKMKFKACKSCVIGITQPYLAGSNPIPSVQAKSTILPLNKWKSVHYIKPKASAGIFTGQTIYQPSQGKVSFLFSPALNVKTGEWNTLEFEMQSDIDGYGRLFFLRPGGKFNDTDRLQFNVKSGEAFQRYSIRIPSTVKAIAGFRLDALHKSAAQIKIRNMRFMTAAQSVLSKPHRQNITALDNWKIENLSKVPNRFDFDFKSGEQSVFRFEFSPFTASSLQQLKIKFDAPGADLTIKDFKFCNLKELSKRYLSVVSGGKSPNREVPNISVLKASQKTGIKWCSNNSSAANPVPVEKAFSGSLITDECYLNFPSDENRYYVSMHWQQIAEGKCRLKIMPFSIFNIPLSPVELELSDKNKWQSVFSLPKDSAYFIAECKDFSLSKDQELDYLYFAPVSLPGNQWRASWIWHGEKNNIRNAFFRNKFLLKGAAKSAKLLITADDVVTAIYVNGIKIPNGKNADILRGVDIHDLSPYLRKGKNILAIQALDTGGGRGLRAEISVQDEFGEHKFICSNAEFKATGTKQENWYIADFQDSKWKPAQEIADYPIRNDLAHEYTGPKKPIHGFKIVKSGYKNGQIYFNPEWEGDLNELSLSVSLLQQNKVSKIYEGNCTKNNEISITIPPFLRTKHCLVKIESSHYNLGENTDFEVQMQLPAKPQLPEVKVVYAPNGRSSFFSIDGKLVSTTHLFASAPTFTAGSNCRKSGVDVAYIFDIKNGCHYVSDGVYDFSGTDKMIRNYLMANPNGYVMPQLVLDSWLVKSYENWNKKHPKEMVADPSGKTLIPIQAFRKEVASWGSDAWREETKNMLRQLIEHIKKQPYASRVIGFMPVAGLGLEWAYYGTHNKAYLDYSEAFRRKFAEFLKNRYNSIENVNRTWHTNYNSFSQITIPLPEERNAEAGTFTFIDPSRRQRLIDFREFFSVVTASLIDELGEVTKKATNGRSLYGTYYGYITYSAMKEWNENGHFALYSLMTSPNIDFLVSIARYDNRWIGMAGGFMMPMASMLLHKKLAIVQSDLRTHRSGERMFGFTKDLRDSAEVLKREMIMNLVNGTSFEFGYFGKGWITLDWRFMQLIKRYVQLEKQLAPVKNLFGDSKERLAIIFDEDSVNNSIQNSPFYKSGISELLNAAAHSGVGFDCYMLKDLDKIVDKHKVFVFSGTYRITPKMLKLIRSRLEKDNKVLVYLHAPGIIDGKRYDAKRIAKVTGIKMLVKNRKVYPDTKLISSKSKVGTYIVPGKISGRWSEVRREPIGPLFIPQEGEVLGKIVETNTPGVVEKEFKDHTTVYAFNTFMAPSLLQGIAAKAGIPITNTSVTDSTRVAGRLVGIHTVKGGEREIVFPVNQTYKYMVDLFSGDKYPLKNNKAEVFLKDFTTYLFMAE
jgi:hypothetical protein